MKNLCSIIERWNLTQYDIKEEVKPTNPDAVTSFPATPFTVKVIISDLNYRSEPSMKGTIKGQTGIGTFTIMEVRNGWGILKSGAERMLGENGDHSSNSLGTLISSYFSVDVENLDPKVVDEVKELRKTVEEANIKIQRQSNELLGNIVNKAVGFGYPNAEELQLGVNTRLQIDDQIKDKTELTYTSTVIGESLPSSHNGLGYKNLIKIEFMLADFAEKIKQGNLACIPLLFIEEPESHMHPQMQQTFRLYSKKPETASQRLTNLLSEDSESV